LKNNCNAKKRLNDEGGIKTLLAYSLIKFFRHCNRNNTTHQVYKIRFTESAEVKFDMTRNTFKTNLLSKLNETNATKLITEQTFYNNVPFLSVAKTIIMELFRYCLTTMTVQTFNRWENVKHREEALALTKATYDAIEVKEATKNVASAIAKEGTIECKQMEDLIIKTIEKNKKQKT
jgi:uncharacterized protein involved in tolerance to divalent cations